MLFVRFSRGPASQSAEHFAYRMRLADTRRQSTCTLSTGVEDGHVKKVAIMAQVLALVQPPYPLHGSYERFSS